MLICAVTDDVTLWLVMDSFLKHLAGEDERGGVEVDDQPRHIHERRHERRGGCRRIEPEFFQNERQH